MVFAWFDLTRKGPYYGEVLINQGLIYQSSLYTSAAVCIASVCVRTLCSLVWTQLFQTSPRNDSRLGPARCLQCKHAKVFALLLTDSGS